MYYIQSCEPALATLMKYVERWRHICIYYLVLTYRSNITIIITISKPWDTTYCIITYILYLFLYLYVYTFIWPLDTKSNECMYLFSLKTVCYDDIAKAIFSFVYVTKNAWKDVGYGTGSSLESWPNLRWLDSIQLFSRVTRLWISWPKGKKLWLVLTKSHTLKVSRDFKTFL